MSFDLRSGEVLAIVGENGAGKSTMIKILAGALNCDEGSILLNGEAFCPGDPSTARNAGIAVIYQDLHLIPQLSVADNIFLHDLPTKRYAYIPLMQKKLIIAKARQLLVKLDFDIDPCTPVERLSRAVRQQVEIAKAFATNAKILIMDEPTASLEAREVEKLFNVIRQIKELGASIIFVSHRLDEVLEIADRVTVFRDGEVVGTRERGEMDGPQLMRLILGRELELDSMSDDYEHGERFCQILAYGSKVLPDPVVVELMNREVLGFTGLIGSGYSDMLKIVCGHELSSRSEISIGKDRRTIRDPYDAVVAGLGYVPEDRKKEGLMMNLSVEDNLIVANLSKVTRWGFLSRKRCRELVDPLVKALKIKTPHLQIPVKNLSGGNQQKVVIARWLASDAQILALIEPTHGIDVGAKFEVHRLIKNFARCRGAVMLSSSELQEIIGVCDRVITFRKGRVAGEIATAKTNQETLMCSIFGNGPCSSEEMDVVDV